MKGKQKFLMVLIAVWLVLLCSGAWAWQVSINGTANGNDVAHAVTVDGAGTVVAAGRTENTGTIDDFTVIKFAGVSGAELWRQVIDATGGFDLANAVAVDGADNVVAAGSIDNGPTSHDFTVVKFDGVSGAELWRQVINGTADMSDLAVAVTVDGAGDVVAAGFTVNVGTGREFTVVKFSGTSGTELWRQVINGTADLNDEANAVAIDGTGDVVAAGFTVNTGSSFDFTVIKFDGGSGAELWQQVINGTLNAIDEAFAVMVDSGSNVVAAGFTDSIGTARDFIVIKFDGASGTELWRQVINGTADLNDEANAVAIDGTGNVVAAGRTKNTGTFDDFTVVKFDGVSGAELWRQAINGTTDMSELALAVTVDGVGDVVAAGLTRNVGTDADFTVVKLRGTDGSDF